MSQNEINITSKHGEMDAYWKKYNGETELML